MSQLRRIDSSRFQSARFFIYSAIALFIFVSSIARAQWITQTIQLKPGWNAVFVEVEPEPRNPTDLFQGIPVESVWAWNQRFNTTQFLTDPNQLVPENPEWLHYYPADNPASIGNNLFLVRGGSPLLIKLAGDANVNWNITGLAHYDSVDWIPNSFNFVGFYIDPANPPTFNSFFAPSTAHLNQPKYYLNSAGDWELITDPQSRTVNPNEAYWIFCNGASRFSGPFIAESDLGFELEFERILTRLPVRFRNLSTATRSITFQQIISLPPPSSELPALAGKVEISYRDDILPNPVGQWINFPNQLSISIGAGQVNQIQLQVRRADLATVFSPPPQGYLYQSILQITDGAGTRIRLPLSAEDSKGSGLATASGKPGLASIRQGGKLGDREGATPVPTPARPEAGLWVGSVTLNAVSEPANAGNSTVVRPAGSELTFRILVHVDGTGAAKFLQQVFMLFQEGTLKDDPNDPSIPPSKIVDQPGRFVLVTNENQINTYTGSLIRDGDAVGRRYSSTAFGFKNPIPMTLSSTFGVSNSTASVTVALPYNDPLNPFFHKFHPDHDNKDRRFENDLGAGYESFNINRNIQLLFTPPPNQTLPAVGQGDKLLIGTYKETITGLHKQAINVQGVFRLNRVSLVEQLN